MKQEEKPKGEVIQDHERMEERDKDEGEILQFETETNGEQKWEGSASPSSFEWIKTAPFWLNEVLQAGSTQTHSDCLFLSASYFFTSILLTYSQLKPTGHSWMKIYFMETECNFDIKLLNKTLIY